MDRNAQGQGSRTQAKVFSKKKKHLYTKFFRLSPKTKVFKSFSGDLQNFNDSRNSAVFKPTTGQFLRTWGFEAKTKDLTFEAKAKDFKMCSRGLHLWQKYKVWKVSELKLLQTLFCLSVVSFGGNKKFKKDRIYFQNCKRRNSFLPIIQIFIFLGQTNLM